MRWFWWVAGIVIFCGMLYECALPGDLAVGPAPGSGLGGTYTVNGVNSSGLEYSGTVVITAAGDPAAYELEWIITGTIQEGTGRLTGDQLRVEWTTVAAAEGAGAGTAEYTLDTDGRLTGTRFAADGAELGTEEILPEA